MSALTLCLFVFTWNIVLGLNEPDRALPKLQYDYAPKGFFDNIDGLPIYVSEQREDPGRCVVWAYDIYGWQSPGRGFEMVDLLNAKTGMIVIYPDFFRGEERPESETYRWETELQARVLKLLMHGLIHVSKLDLIFMLFSLIGMTLLSHTFLGETVLP